MGNPNVQEEEEEADPEKPPGKWELESQKANEECDAGKSRQWGVSERGTGPPCAAQNLARPRGVAAVHCWTGGP